MDAPRRLGRSGARGVSQKRWPLPVEPLEEELLSSFLVRAAQQHGLSPYRFCAFHFPGVPVWNRDIDRSASDSLIAALGVKAGLPTTRVAQMTLCGAEAKLSKGAARGSAHWINRVGIYHRLRRGWGLQYCPDCLAERPVLCQAWRMSFMVVCSRHQRLLQDACPHCDAPLAIHRQMLSMQLCHHCSRVLGRIPQDASVPIDTLLRAQSYFERALHGGTGEIGGQAVCREDLFQGARVLASMLAPRLPLPRAPAGQRRRSFELARVQPRANVVLRVAEALASWPLELKRIAKEQNLTQRSFVRSSLPDWLRSAVEELPAGRARHSLPKKRHALRAKLEYDRRRSMDWRTTRAALLWEAAVR
ncbi:TniQ family protein [Luteimonas sp. S4-F44]|uniref:TniQ family protein n=1 Tax=Luteimonas sp. S4-F44 TaxID=2925842 RepID=UPI001F53B7B4|nr:TniQ family protein [Luteimonas sp. S4-F44]UNK42457.1 TniQ family protein [Luteimonas sp. S4-F44]